MKRLKKWRTGVALATLALAAVPAQAEVLFWSTQAKPV